LKNKIYFNDLTYQNEKIKSKVFSGVNQMLSMSSFILGKELETFENNFAKFSSSNYFISVSNGTDAIEISIRALELPPLSEIVVPANSFIASAIAVLKTNHKLVLADVDKENLLLGVPNIEKAFSKNTRVVMPVHLYGQSAPMNQINNFVKNKNLYVIEDAAQAQGAKHNGKNVGTFGEVSATSFYPGKNLGAWGDAGGIFTQKKSLDSKIRKIRNYGSKKKYIHDIFGSNFRMDTLQAIVLNEKLKFLDKWNEERRKIAQIYCEQLKEIEAIFIPKTITGNLHIYHLFVVLAQKRNALKKYLLENGIETLIHYPVPIYRQKYLANDYEPKNFPNTEYASRHLLSLPMYPGLSPGEIDRVVETIKRFYNK